MKNFEQLTDENLKDVKIAEFEGNLCFFLLKELVDTKKLKNFLKTMFLNLKKKIRLFKLIKKSITKLGESVTDLTNKLSKASEDLTKIHREETKQREQLGLLGELYYFD